MKHTQINWNPIKLNQTLTESKESINHQKSCYESENVYQYPALLLKNYSLELEKFVKFEIYGIWDLIIRMIMIFKVLNRK